MLILHLFSGLVVAFSVAFFAWFEGASFWAMLGIYVIGGNLGIAASAAVSLVLPRMYATRHSHDLYPAE